MNAEMVYELAFVMGRIIGVAIAGWLFMYGLKKWKVLYKRIKGEKLWGSRNN